MLGEVALAGARGGGRGARCSGWAGCCVSVAPLDWVAAVAWGVVVVVVLPAGATGVIVWLAAQLRRPGGRGCGGRRRSPRAPPGRRARGRRPPTSPAPGGRRRRSAPARRAALRPGRPGAGGGPRRCATRRGAHAGRWRRWRRLSASPRRVVPRPSRPRGWWAGGPRPTCPEDRAVARHRACDRRRRPRSPRDGAGSPRILGP